MIFLEIKKCSLLKLLIYLFICLSQYFFQNSQKSFKIRKLPISEPFPIHEFSIVLLVIK